MKRFLPALFCFFALSVAIPSLAVQPLSPSKTYVDTQDALKAPLASPTFTGVVTAPEYASSAADGAHILNASNTTDPTSPVEGDCQFNKTGDQWKCFNGTSWLIPGGGISNIVEDITPQLGGNLDLNTFSIAGVTPTEFSYLDPTSSVQTQLNAKAPSADPVFTGSVALPQGAAPTVDAAGEIAVDTTASQLKYFGTAAKVLDPRFTENASFKTPTSGDKAKFRKPYGMTVSSVGCVTDAATSVVLDVQECNANGATCVTILSATITCGTTYGTGTISDSAIAAGGYVFFSLGTVTGTPGYLYVDFNYTVVGE